MQITRDIRKSGSKLLGIWLFLSILLLKEAFPKPAYAFLSSRDSCLAQPQCAAAIAEEAVTAVAAPTASGVSATIGATTATGASTTTQVAAGVALVGDLRLSGIAAYYLWSQAVNGQAQEIARQRYCAAYPFDAVCGPPAQGSKVWYYVNYQNKGYWQENFQTREYTYAIWGPVEGIVREEKNPSPGYYHAQIYIRGRDHLGNVKYYWTQGASGTKIVLGIDSRITRILRSDGQPETDPPPLPWEDWPQQKRSIAVASLTNSDWQGLIKSMPVGGRLNPGDKVNAPTIVIPGQPEDDPNTPADERLLRKDQGFFTDPGLPNRDFDRDGTPDTSDPEPQNPNVPIASSEPPPAEESVPGVDVPFSAPDPSQPPNEAVTDKARNMNLPDGKDCSEIAEDLLEAAGNVGEIIEVLPAAGHYLTLYENSQVESGFFYHQVYTDGTYVYDPRLSPDPVRRGEWEEMIRKLNPGAIFQDIQ